MISNLDQRVMYFNSQTGQFLDYTIQVNEFNNGKTASIQLNPGDYLYITSFLPFNHKYFMIGGPPSSTATTRPLIEYNNNNEWYRAADLLDYTDFFKESGVLQFTPDYDKSWGLVGRSSTEVTALVNAPVVYDSYWMRISFPDETDPVEFELEYVGQKFSSDDDLFQEYPMLQAPKLLENWKTGKTSWDDQHLLAATYVAKELVKRDILINNAQILDIATLRGPSVHKTAVIIYSGIGARNFKDEIALADSKFEKAMRMDKFQVDLNANARKDRPEVCVTTSRASR